MTEPSKEAIARAVAEYTRALRWATGDKRAEEANGYAMLQALRAAYAVDGGKK